MLQSLPLKQTEQEPGQNQFTPLSEPSCFQFLFTHSWPCNACGRRRHPVAQGWLSPSMGLRTSLVRGDTPRNIPLAKALCRG